MHTLTIGQVLKQERQRHQLSLSALAQKTRIRQEYLEALENNDFAKLPAATFVKGYIKTYAKVFGFDHQPLLALLRRDYKESAKGKLVPREFLKPVLRQRKSLTSVTLVMVALGSIFVSLVGYIGFQWYNLNKPPVLAVTNPADQDQVGPQVIIEGKTVPEALVSVNQQPVALQPDGSFSTEVFLPSEGVTTLTVEATDRRGKTNRVQRTVYVQF